MQTLEKTGQKSTDENYSYNITPRQTGDTAEYFVCYEAARRGAEVFYNNGSRGQTDLILKINGQLYEINVKSDTFVKGSWGAYNAGPSNVKAPVWPVCVTPYPEGYSARWPRKHGGDSKKIGVRCPPGLEDFWS